LAGIADFYCHANHWPINQKGKKEDGQKGKSPRPYFLLQHHQEQTGEFSFTF